ncbi:hypothetical protein D3C73_1636240 [compost metagenome]
MPDGGILLGGGGADLLHSRGSFLGDCRHMLEGIDKLVILDPDHIYLVVDIVYLGGYLYH